MGRGSEERKVKRFVATVVAKQSSGGHAPLTGSCKHWPCLMPNRLPSTPTCPFLSSLVTFFPSRTVSGTTLHHVCHCKGNPLKVGQHRPTHHKVHSAQEPVPGLEGYGPQRRWRDCCKWGLPRLNRADKGDTNGQTRCQIGIVEDALNGSGIALGHVRKITIRSMSVSVIHHGLGYLRKPCTKGIELKGHLQHEKTISIVSERISRM